VSDHTVNTTRTYWLGFFRPKQTWRHNLTAKQLKNFWKRTMKNVIGTPMKN